MDRRNFLITGAPALLLAGCSGGNKTPQVCPPGMTGIYPNCQWLPPPPPPPPPQGQWNMGPQIRGAQYSIGMPTTVGDRWEFPSPTKEVPYPHAGYVTRPISLAGKTRIRMTWEIEGEGPFLAAVDTQIPPYLCFHFQRNGDDWSGVNQFESYRWYSKDQVNLAPGPASLEVPLQWSAWVSVMGKATEADFAAALNDVCCTGFAFGGASGKGHGAYATKPGSFFVLKSYDAF